MQDEVRFVLDDPLHDFSFREIHGLGDGGGEIDVILVSGFLSLDELHFGWVSHDASFLLAVKAINL